MSDAQAQLGVDQLAALWEEAVPGERLPEEVLRERLLEDPDCDLSLWLAARHGGRLVGAAVGVVRPDPAGGKPAGYVQFLAVTPAFRRQKVASRLLDELERRLVSKGVRAIRAFDSAPSYLWPGIDVQFTPALCLFERRGYALRSYEFNMKVDLIRPLAAPPEKERRQALEQAGIAVRRLRPEDEASLGDWMLRTWGPHWAYEVGVALRRQPPAGFVAVQDGQWIGFAVYDSGRPGWFGPMGVEPRWQGTGLGIELCVRCFEDMAQRGYTEAQIAWAGPRCFYARKLGASISRVFARMEKVVDVADEEQRGGRPA
ncbi:MAG: GNAT family N-acetyltransferase [Limnochordaceae bacterium]|nr:GNAT family N-acetyltransferase [Limnochordaceae bacterium]